MRRVIRLWTIGKIDKDNINNSYVPSQEAIERFERRLATLPKNEKEIDFVCGPEVSLTIYEYDDDTPTNRQYSNYEVVLLGSAEKDPI